MIHRNSRPRLLGTSHPSVKMLFVLLILTVFGVEGVIAAPLSQHDFAITSVVDGKTIALKDPISKVISDLGSPPRATIEIKQPPDEGPWDVFRYEYPGLTVGFMRGWPTIEFLKLESRLFKTARGIRVGDTYAEVVRQYGPPISRSSERAVYQLKVASSKNGEPADWFSLDFELRSDKVTAIWVNIAGE